MDAQQPAADDPQLVEVGQRPLTAAFLQPEQDLGLDQRGQAPQHDLAAAGDRSARLAPGTEVGDRECSRAVLLPPADVVRAAQSPPGMRLLSRNVTAPVSGLRGSRAAPFHGGATAGEFAAAGRGGAMAVWLTSPDE
jgi:hypothetical protein